jgi:hypothetical protein
MTAFTPWTATAFLPWAWRAEVGEARGSHDLSGYTVEAADGRIGKIDQATYDTGDAHVVVDTGPWIFGRKVLIPAGAINHVDPDEQIVYVDRTKDQIKHAPEYDEVKAAESDYREHIGAYYRETYK